MLLLCVLVPPVLFGLTVSGPDFCICVLCGALRVIWDACVFVYCSMLDSFSWFRSLVFEVALGSL